LRPENAIVQGVNPPLKVEKIWTPMYLEYFEYGMLWYLYSKIWLLNMVNHLT
jgi:hypothetical protein